MSGPLNEFTLPGALEELARGRGQHAAYIDGARTFTYAEALARAHRLANALEARGIGRGDRILWLAQNSYRIVEGVLAASLLGALFCPVNWRQSGEEIAFIIDDFSPKLVIWQEEEIGAALAEGRKRATWQAELWLRHDPSGAADEYETFLSDGEATSKQRGTDAASTPLVVYTAAFAGRPNGALISQTAILTQSLSVQLVQDISAATVFLNSGPMFHVGTLMTTFATFAAGGTNVFVRRTEPETLCQLIHETRATFAFLIPKTCQDMVEVNRDGRYDLKCLTSPSYFPEWDAMVTINPRDLRNGPYGYGQTEVNGLVIWTFFSLPGDKGHSGRPAPGTQLRIVDPDDRELPAGAVGEIVLRGPTVMSGYWNRPDLNAERQRGGWHHTNDLGRREPDGSISFVGPKTQMIKSGVENIYPAEVEGCLRRHPAVADAAIIGVPDPAFTQCVKAIVQVRDGAGVTESELIDHCKAHLASYKKPRYVAFVSALPRTKIGMIDYPALDAAHGGGNYPGQAWQSSKRA